MNKDEILAKSRAENKNKDVCDIEIQRMGAAWGNAIMITLGVIFFGLEISITGGKNYSFYAMMCASAMAAFWYKWVKLKKTHELWTAVIYTLCTVSFSAAYIVSLIRR